MTPKKKLINFNKNILAIDNNNFLWYYFFKRVKISNSLNERKKL